MQRRVFFISDRTGISAETLGETLLTQFQHIEFVRTDIPFVTSPEKARLAVAQIAAAEKADGAAPLIFSTLTDPESQSIIATGTNHVFDLFGTYIEPLERALGVESSRTAGRMHGMTNTDEYQHRVDALNFALDHDDGLAERGSADRRGHRRAAGTDDREVQSLTHAPILDLQVGLKVKCSEETS